MMSFPSLTILSCGNEYVITLDSGFNIYNQSKNILAFFYPYANFPFIASELELDYCDQELNVR